MNITYIFNINNITNNIIYFLFFISSLRFLAKTSLVIENVGRRDRGVYQCLVENQKSSAQAMAELKLGGKST